MPKLKTKSSAKKRFKVTGSGKLKRKHAFKSHILTKKSKKRKLKLTHDTLVHKSDEANIKQQLNLKTVIIKLKALIITIMTNIDKTILTISGNSLIPKMP